MFTDDDDLSGYWELEQIIPQVGYQGNSQAASSQLTNPQVDYQVSYQEAQEVYMFGQKLVQLSNIIQSAKWSNQLTSFEKTIQTTTVKKVVQTIKEKVYCQYYLSAIAYYFNLFPFLRGSFIQQVQFVFDHLMKLSQEQNKINAFNKRISQEMKTISFNSSSLSLQEKLILLIQQVKTSEKLLQLATQAKSDQCTSIKYDYATAGIQKYGTLLQQNIKSEKQLRNKQMGELNEFKKRFLGGISLNFNDSLAENCSKLKKHYQMKMKSTRSYYESQLKDIDDFLKNIKQQDKKADKTQYICQISIKKKLKDLKEQLFLAEKAIKELQDERKANEKQKASFQELLKEHSLEIQRLRQSCEQEKASLQQQHSSQVSRLKDSLPVLNKNIMEKFIEQHSQEISRLKKSSEKAKASLIALVEKHLQEISRLKKLNEKAKATLIALVEKHLQEISRLKQFSEKAKTSLILQNSQKLLRSIQSSEKQMVSLLNQHSLDPSKLSQANEKQKAFLQKLLQQNSLKILGLKENFTILEKENERERQKMQRMLNRIIEEKLFYQLVIKG